MLDFSRNILEDSLEKLLDENIIQEHNYEIKAKLSMANRQAGVYLYQADCLDIMDKIIELYPEGCFDMIFSKPEILKDNQINFSNKITEISQAEDYFKNLDLNHEYNYNWISRCQKLLNKNAVMWLYLNEQNIFSVGNIMEQLGFDIIKHIAINIDNKLKYLICAKKNQFSNFKLNKNLNISSNNIIDIIENLVVNSSKEDDFIFDPFSSELATTAIASIRNKRKFCGTAKKNTDKTTKIINQEIANEFC